MFESVIEGYLREFSERLTKIEEAQKKNSRTKDEERRNEEEKVKAAIERSKEFKAFTESFKEKMELMQGNSKRPKRLMITLPPWEASPKKSLRNYHPSLLYMRLIGSMEWANLSNTRGNI